MKGQKGFTLVELLIATAITGVIVASLGTAIYQVVTVSSYGNDRLTAAHELQNAALWFTRDGMNAREASGGPGLVLSMADNSTIVYSLVGTELRRTSGGNTWVLGRNIVSADFSVVGRLTTMQLATSPSWQDGISQNGTYRVYLRPSGGG